ncbi:MAG: hypothetical protein RIM99_18750 [Cyclobacteriaceae bacterium]
MIKIKCRSNHHNPFGQAVNSILLALLVSGIFGCEQHLEIPLEVSSAFWAKYEDARSIEWSTENDTYTVSYDLQGLSRSATFKTDGEWVKTISNHPPEKPIACLQDFVDENYLETKVDEVVFVETPASEKYILLLNVIQKHRKEESNSADETNLNDSILENEETATQIVLEFHSNCELITKKVK